MPTDTFEDGSPRYDHGHDFATGETWWAATGTAVATLRRCPACQLDHAVLTTCMQWRECQASDLTTLAREMFGDLLLGGVEAQAALLRHNGNLGCDAACGGDCGVPDCGRPFFDEAGLTRCRGSARGPSHEPDG